ISSLYVLVSVKEVFLEPGIFAAAWAIGLASVLLSAWFPAHAAAGMEPVRALEGGTGLERSFHLSSSWWISGLLSLALSGVFSFLVPGLTSHFSSGAGASFRALRRLRRKAMMEAELGAANLSRTLLRNSITIAAFAVAVAMTVGVSVMVFSFRKTVEAWINQTLVADLFVAPASNEVVGPDSFMP